MHLPMSLFHYDLLACKVSYTICNPSVDGVRFPPTLDCFVIPSLYQLLSIFNQFSVIYKSNFSVNSYQHISGEYKVE